MRSSPYTTSIPSHARCASARACSFRPAVAVVQQRREQRRRRRHPAAALRQRQRRVLVPQQLRQQPVRPPHARLRSLRIDRNPQRQRVDEQPSTRSAPSPPCIRPNSTVPNTTSSRPVSRASTCAHARWHRLAALTPRRRARCRSRRARSRLHLPPRFLDPAAVALHIQQPERRRRLLDIAQQLAEERLVLLPAHAQPRLRHEVAERQRRRQLARSPQQMRLRSPRRTISSVV